MEREEIEEEKKFSAPGLIGGGGGIGFEFSGDIGKKGKEKQGLHAVVREGGTSGRRLRGRHARADDLDTWQSFSLLPPDLTIDVFDDHTGHGLETADRPDSRVSFGSYSYGNA